MPRFLKRMLVRKTSRQRPALHTQRRRETTAKYKQTFREDRPRRQRLAHPLDVEPHPHRSCVVEPHIARDHPQTFMPHSKPMARIEVEPHIALLLMQIERL